MEKKSRSNFCDTFCILGFPDEIGIQNVGGRLGAKAGPDSFMGAFLKLNGKNPVQEKMAFSDILNLGADLESNYLQATERVRVSARSSYVIGVGGGHDYAYPWIKGLSESFDKKGSKKPKIGCINLDAHFDLRDHLPRMTSGSPFRRLIEEEILSPAHLVEFGIQSHCNAPALWEYVRKKKIKTIPFEKLRRERAVPEFVKALTQLKKSCDQVVISLDLDSLSLAYCPGVSAPQSEGFSSQEIHQMLEIAGADKKVTSLGIFELSPALDFQNLTSRVAAQATWHFLNAKLYP